ncbi:hypothetical protein MN116_003621 [Schistosoma mekongi]|uniref:Uncharacterized protein n=1 Tax=Schistosoma mekongi TaxID=38744 RepID=A0AAE2D6Y5_SCHME|nr:hypothetical protein MN116_003621 [Schistosoma mekongi]
MGVYIRIHAYMQIGKSNLEQNNWKMCISVSAFKKYYLPEPRKPYLHSRKSESPSAGLTRSVYLRSQVNSSRMERKQLKNLKSDNSNILTCHVPTEPIYKSVTNSLVKQLSIKPKDLYSYLIGSQMITKIKQEISKSAYSKKKNNPNCSAVVSNLTTYNKIKVKRRSQTSKLSASCKSTNIVDSLGNTNCLIIKSKNALSQSCSVTTRLNLIETNDLTSNFVNMENNISVCLKIQGVPRKSTTLYTKQKSSLSENDILKVVSPRLSRQHNQSYTQKSFDNIVLSGRTCSIPSISAERIKSILNEELCIHGYQSGCTPKTLNFHELHNIAKNQLETTSHNSTQKQFKLSHRKSTRPKSAGEAYNRIRSTSSIKEILSIQSIYTPPKPFHFNERQPNRIRSAREYRRKHIDHEFDSLLSSEDTLSQQNNDTSVSNQATEISIHSSRQRADIHLPSVKHLMEIYDEIEE